MLDAYSQLVRIYDSYMAEFGPTNVPSKGDCIMPPVFYNKVRHSEKQPVYIIDVDDDGNGRIIGPAKEVFDDEYHSTLCPSTLSQRVIGSSSRNREFQFFTKMGILANCSTKEKWMNLYSLWAEKDPTALQVKAIVSYVSKTDFESMMPETDPYVIFYINGKNIFVNNEALYYSYVEFYTAYLSNNQEYNTRKCWDWLSNEEGNVVLGKNNDFLSFGINWANLSKLITKTNPGTTLENHDIFPTTKKNFSSFCLSVESNLKIVLAFDYLCEMKKQFGDTRRIVFLSPEKVSFSNFIRFNKMASDISNYSLMRIPASSVLKGIENAEITVLVWKQNDLAKSSIVKCEEIKVCDYVSNINNFVGYISQYVDNFIYRLEHTKNKREDIVPMFTMNNLLGNFYFKGTSLMSQRIESVYDSIIYGKPIPKSVIEDMQRHLVKMIQSQSLTQIQRHYKGYKNSRNYIQDSLCLLTGMIKYNQSFNREEQYMKDRSYIYGQILAVYQKIEELVQWGNGNKTRPTIVEKNLANFINNPNKYWMLIFERMSPYLTKTYGKYKHMPEELFTELPCVSDDGIAPDNEIITSNFLLGYYQQLAQMNKVSDDKEEKENDHE